METSDGDNLLSLNCRLTWVLIRWLWEPWMTVEE